MLEVLESVRCVPLCILEAVEGVLCLLEVLEVTRCVLLCMRDRLDGPKGGAKALKESSTYKHEDGELRSVLHQNKVKAEIEVSNFIVFKILLENEVSECKCLPIVNGPNKRGERSRYCNLARCYGSSI